MGWSRRKRTAWAAGLSAVLHVLMLTGMVVGLKVATPPPEPEAIELSLIRPLPRLRPPPPAPVPQTPIPQTTRAGPQLRPRPAPTPPAGVPTVALPPAPPAPPPRVYGPGVAEGGVKPSLSGRVGCDEDPLARKELTETQRQACANNMTARAKAAPQLPLNIPAAKLAEYDKADRCHQAYGKQGIPRSTDPTDDTVATNAPGVPLTGLGYVPANKDCGFGQR